MIVAACSVRRIPGQWPAQTRPGGKIFTTQSGWLHGYARELRPFAADRVPRHRRPGVRTAVAILIDRKIALREQRQARLEGPNTPAYWTIMNEAALLRSPGNPEMMRAQLAYIVERMDLPRVTVQVLPFTAGMHPAMDGPFEILGFPESLDLDVVYLESQTGALYLEDRTQVGRYDEIFNHLRAKALDPDKSRALIAQKLREAT
jgi:Domain of unknown function (DUF5753)